MFIAQPSWCSHTGSWGRKSLMRLKWFVQTSSIGWDQQRERWRRRYGLGENCQVTSETKCHSMPYFNVMKSACSPFNEPPRKRFPWCFPPGSYCIKMSHIDYMVVFIVPDHWQILYFVFVNGKLYPKMQKTYLQTTGHQGNYHPMRLGALAAVITL